MTESIEMPIKFFKINIAGKNIEIECRYRYVFRLCRLYLANFEEPDFVVSASDNDIYQESKDINIPDLGIHYDNVAIGPSMDVLESMSIYHKIAKKLVDDGFLLLHGAAVAVNNKCYIFIAPSGTGKTTHILHWLKLIPDALVVNGDKPLVDIIRKRVYGTPWCGKEGLNTNISVSLGGIITLERGEQNIINNIDFKEIFPSLLNQCYIPNEVDLAGKVLRLIGGLRDVPCFKLICNTEEESALISYNGLLSYL